MKTNYVVLGLVLGAFMFQSCEDDDNNRQSGNQEVEQAFTTKYPDAAQVDWERKGNYSVVDFRKGNNEMEAWFDQNGVWYMTETDLVYQNLPEAIKNAFSTSEYKAWHIDDIDMIERKDMETVYILEIESGKQESDLYYSSDGTLIKVTVDTNNNDDNEHYLPSSMDDAVKTYISTNYPQAKILETENEKGMIEVDIKDGSVYRELLFEADGDWVYTKTQVRKSAVPQTVIDALEKSEYASYAIDDIYYYETQQQQNYYYFELESHSTDVDLKITTAGVLEVIKISRD